MHSDSPTGYTSQTWRACMPKSFPFADLLIIWRGVRGPVINTKLAVCARLCSAVRPACPPSANMFLIQAICVFARQSDRTERLLAVRMCMPVQIVHAIIREHIVVFNMHVVLSCTQVQHQVDWFTPVLVTR